MIFGRIVRAVDPVADVGRGSQRLEPVQKTGRHIQMPKVVIVEQKCLLRSERRRLSPNVDEHVVDGAVGAAHQFRFTTPGAGMHAADHSLRRTRLRILHEGSGHSRHAEVIVEDIGVESSGEQAALVAEGLWDQDENVRKVCRLDAHKEMLS